MKAGEGREGNDVDRSIMKEEKEGRKDGRMDGRKEIRTEGR